MLASLLANFLDCTSDDGSPEETFTSSPPPLTCGKRMKLSDFDDMQRHAKRVKIQWEAKHGNLHRSQPCGPARNTVRRDSNAHAEHVHGRLREESAKRNRVKSGVDMARGHVVHGRDDLHASGSEVLRQNTWRMARQELVNDSRVADKPQQGHKAQARDVMCCADIFAMRPCGAAHMHVCDGVAPD
jgi:hypothetical protein